MVKSNLHIILSAAVSIDGKIATYTGDSKLSSRQDIVRLHKLRSKVDAILIGKNTAIWMFNRVGSMFGFTQRSVCCSDLPLASN